MSELTETERKEVIQHAHRACIVAMANFAAGLDGLDPTDGGKILLSAAATIFAAHHGQEAAATMLYGLADALAVGRDPRELN